MRGDLSETPAADVCRALASADATGVLDIEGPDGRGAVVLRDGHVVAATSPTPRARIGDRLVHAGLLAEEGLTEVLRSQARAEPHQRTGALLVGRGLVPLEAVRQVVQEQVIDAVFDLVRWRSGAYRFDVGGLTEVPEVPLRIPVDQLLVEVARRQRQWDELEVVIPDLDAVPTFRPGAEPATASLTPDEFAVLASIDGVRSIRELANDLGYGQFEAARIVYGLTLLGTVDIVLPDDEVGRALEDALQDLAVGTRHGDQPPPGAGPDVASAPGTGSAPGSPAAPPVGLARDEVAELLRELSRLARGGDDYRG